LALHASLLIGGASENFV